MKKKILVVDDLEKNRYMLRMLLEGHGYEVAEARDGIVALATARRDPPQAVITDLLMPEMDGFAFCREWMKDERLCEIPLIVYTATFTDAKDRQLALDIGAADFIVKPAEPEELTQSLLASLEKAQPGARKNVEVTNGDFYERYSTRLRQKLDQKIDKLASAERLLADYVTRCEAILDASPSAIVALDADRKIRAWNYAAERMFGYSESEAVAHPLEMLVPPARQDEAREMLAKVRARKEIIRFETQRLRKDGTLIDVAISLTFLGPEIGSVAVVSDLSDLRKAAEEKKKLEAQIAQADRLASMGMLAAGVAHEINNPLSYILYNLESLTEDLPDLLDAMRGFQNQIAEHLGQDKLEEVAGATLGKLNAAFLGDVRDRFNDALMGTRRIRDIARGLGTFSRVEDDHLAPVNLMHVIEVAINMAFNEIKYRARVVKDYGKTPIVMASEGRLSQVFLNLFINAAHAVDEGDVENNEIRVRTWTDANSVYAEISDTGKGILPDHLDRLFEPFFTTKKVGAGSGLGLAISKNIIEGYGGAIEVRSEPGKGTSFTIRLPIQVQKEVPAPDVAKPQVGPQVRGRVLIVDDEAGIRSAMVRMLRDHDTVEAANGAEARAVLENDQAFDVIVCDMMMSEVSGVDLHQWLSKEHPALAKQFMFITGGAFTSRAREYLTEVDNIRLEKPFDVANFKKIVGDLVRLARSTGNVDI